VEKKPITFIVIRFRTLIMGCSYNPLYSPTPFWVNKSHSWGPTTSKVVESYSSGPLIISSYLSDVCFLKNRTFDRKLLDVYLEDGRDIGGLKKNAKGCVFYENFSQELSLTKKLFFLHHNNFIFSRVASP